MRRLLAISISLVALVAATSCVYPEQTAHFSKSWPAAGIKRIVVRGVNGRIDITAAAVDRISLLADARFRGHKTVAEGDAFDTEVHGDELEIREHNRQHFGGMVIFGGHRLARVDFHVVVPAGLEAVTANSVNGKIALTGVRGKLEAQSVNGTIDVETPDGELTAETVNGRVNANFVARFSGAHLRTVNGSIAIAVPPNSTIDCDIHQVNGSFRSDLPVRMNGAGEPQPNASTLEATTVNGSISVRQRGGKA
jgi:hypothetical protein